MYVYENSTKNKYNEILKSVKSLASGKENILFPDSPDFEKFTDFLSGHDVK